MTVPTDVWRPRRLVRAAVGLTLGAVTAVVEIALLTVAALLMAYSLAFSRGQRTVPAVVADAARAATELERRRLRRFHGEDRAVRYGPLKALAYLVLRVPVGLLGGVILIMVVYGAVIVTALAVSWWITGDYMDGIPPSPLIVVYTAILGSVLLFLAVQGLVGVVALEKTVVRRCLGPSPLEAYERRIAQLAVTRAEVVDAVDDERRRIERDLHDGVQQRLVALGMLIGRARRAGDPDRSAELLRQAHEESQRALEDLREVTWRVYPAALDREGLRVALETVAERSAVPVTIDFDVPGRLPHAVETVAYFVVCEAVTNAAKHSGARHVRVEVTGSATLVGVRIEDDGGGGADPGGGGLAGLARRVAALDGTFGVDSPPGGPTVITAELPCG
ncbi:signal transduction histidine kinase [Actinomadura pelletieri DSM 43383]|uniref:histidine kinase n=1 Tax=Actinomadura pelletieri DSM 43383 TaxID=1120940 RepID=A0A495QMY7_9ACTN|nr:histidine kinase [Actinomadura pelletieri]RKS74345.1 signal transduction histidine kinase [Actinomadura pelletieri DSM 43383]